MRDVHEEETGDASAASTPEFQTLGAIRLTTCVSRVVALDGTARHSGKEGVEKPD